MSNDARNQAARGARPSLGPRGKDRRADIVRSAKELFAKHGYESTRMTDIAESAGITKGLLYWYFESKAGSVADIILPTQGRLRTALGEASGTTDEPLEAIDVGSVAAERLVVGRRNLHA